MTVNQGLESVYLNGAGVCCALGRDLITAHGRYLAGKKAFFKDPRAIGADGLSITYSPVFRLHDIHNHEERLRQMMALAVEDIASQLSVSDHPVRVLMYLPAWLRPSGFGQRPSDWPASFDRLADTDFAAIYSDQTSCVSVMAHAMQTIVDQPDHDVILAVADTFLIAELLDHLAMANRILSRHQPHGLIPSEAAVVLRFAPAHRVAPHAPIGRIDGHWSAVETQDPHAPDDMLGDAMATAFCAGASYARVDRLMIDLNGERWRSEEVAMCLARSEGIHPSLTADFETPPLLLGHCGQATPALMAAFACMPGKNPMATDMSERSLITSAMFSGTRDVFGIIRDTRSGLHEKATAS